MLLLNLQAMAGEKVLDGFLLSLKWLSILVFVERD
jgi:hypothetical protein